MPLSQSLWAFVQDALPAGQTYPYLRSIFESWCLAAMRSSLASSLILERSRAASISGVGGVHST